MPLEQLEGNLNEQQAVHLLRRATFGPSLESVQQFTGIGVDAAMNILFDPSVPDPELPVDPQTGSTWINPAATGANSPQEDLMDYFMGWHLEQMRTSGTSSRERIVWFLHTHLPVRRTLVTNSESIYYQNALYRHYAFGSFKILFRKLCVDNAMLIYLDNATNDVNDPNENFAREMFELYSIGRGPQTDPGNYTNYTEDDIREAAKVLTGWETDESYATVDPDTGLPFGRLISEISGSTEIATRHNAGSKAFSAAFQNTSIQPSETVEGYATVEAAEGELDKMMDMIFDQEATALFLVRKIYRHFVYYEISDEVENNIIQPLAEDFRNNDYSLSYVLKELFSSQHFYDRDDMDTDNNNRGAIIKSPIDLIMGMVNLFNVEFPADPGELYQTVYQEGLLEMIYEQGLDLYEPYDVAGYDAYYQYPIFNRYWITPYTLAYRYKLSDFLIYGTNQGSDPLGIKLDILTWVADTDNVSDPSSADDLVARLCNLMFAFPIHPDRQAYFRDDIFLDGVYSSAWTTEWNTYLDNGSNEATVRTMLERLLRGMIQTPEYQLY